MKQFSKAVYLTRGLLTAAVLLFATVAARADLIINEFAATFGSIQVNTADLKQFSLNDGLITLTTGDNVSGMTIDPIEFDLTGYAGPLGTPNPVAVIDDTITIRLESTLASYEVVSAEMTQLLNTPIAIGFIDLILELDTSNLAVGGEDILVPPMLTSAITLNGLKVTVVEEPGGQKNGNARLGSVASASLTAIPEPTTCTLLGIGFLIVGLRLRSRSRG